jgi:hypothetical protein
LVNSHRPNLFRAIFCGPQTIMKIVVAIAFILILSSLGSALVFLMKDKGKSDRTLKALALRVGFSIALFVLILIAHQLGWIQPTGLR